MLNLPALHFQEKSEGRVLASVYSEVSGISERTLRKAGDLSPDTIKNAQQHSRDFVKGQLDKNGYSPEEIETWLTLHPGYGSPGMFYSDLVYGCQIEGFISFPHTIELASAIDRLSTRLVEARQRNDLAGFKDALLNHPVLGPAYFAQNGAPTTQTTNTPLHEQLRTAEDWAAIYQPLAAVTSHSLLSLLALWDVEFCSQYFSSFAPRSCFAMVLPRLDPKAGNADAGKIEKRKGMFWYPVRRLIGLMASLGGFARNQRWPVRVPEVEDVASKTVEFKQNLVNWRDGTKKFTRRDFTHIWHKLCPDHKGSTGPIRAPEPSPLFVATVFWQALLVDVSTTSKVKSIMLIEDDYLRWWTMHHEALRAKGNVFGTSPWPPCFNEI